MKSSSYVFPISVECLEEGGYFAECPLLKGCHVEGKTYAEAVENLEDAIQVFLKSYKELGKASPRIPRIRGRAIVTGGIPVRIKGVG